MEFHIFRADRQKRLFEKTLEDLQDKLDAEKVKQDNYPVGYLNRATSDGKVEMLEYAIKCLTDNNDFINTYFV